MIDVVTYYLILMPCLVVALGIIWGVAMHQTSIEYKKRERIAQIEAAFQDARVKMNDAVGQSWRNYSEW